MATTIKFSYNGQDYTLEYTRKTVVALEQLGFSPKDAIDKPTYAIPLLFAGAFKAHHPLLRSEVIDDILKSLDDKSKLFETLITMYQEPLESLISEPENSKKVVWELGN